MVNFPSHYAIKTRAYRAMRGLGLCAMFCAISAVQSSGSEYTVDGSVTLYSFGPSGDVVSSITRGFQVSVDGCHWRIRTTNNTPQGTAATIWETSSPDDGQIYRAIYYPQNPRSHTLALVESNTIPSACNDGVSQYLWLMFASGCYLDRVGTNMLPPIYEPLLNVLFDKDMKYPAFWNRLQQPPRLPNEIVYMNDGFYRTRDKDNKTTILIKNQPPFEDGYTNAVFTVSGVTNVGGIEIPTGFSFVEYHATLLTDGPGLVSSRKMEASVSRAASAGAMSSVLPSLGTRVVVQDRRLMDSQRPSAVETYNIKDGKWKSTDEMKEIVGARSQQNRTDVRLWVRLCLGVCVLMILPVILFLRKVGGRPVK